MAYRERPDSSFERSATEVASDIANLLGGKVLKRGLNSSLHDCLKPIDLLETSCLQALSPQNYSISEVRSATTRENTCTFPRESLKVVLEDFPKHRHSVVFLVVGVPCHSNW